MDNTSKQSTDPTKDTSRKGDTSEPSSSSGIKWGRQLTNMMKGSAEIDKERDLYQSILGENYDRRPKKRDRFKEIDARLQAAERYIKINIDRIEDKEYFEYLVSRYKENREGAFKDKSKPLQYTFERTCRDFTESLEAIVDGLQDTGGVVPETPNSIVAAHNILKHSESSLNDEERLKEYTDKLDLTDRTKFEERINRAKEGLERYKQVIDAAPDDIKDILLPKTVLNRTGYEILAMFLGLKPAIFGSSIEVTLTSITKLRTLYDIRDKDTENTNEKAILLSRRIRDHIVSNDPDGDYRAIELNRPYPPMVTYSLKDTIQSCEAHPNIFGSEHSKESVDTLYRTLLEGPKDGKQTEEQRQERDRKIGLLCGYPGSAVEEICEQQGESLSPIKACRLPGMDFSYRNSNRDIQPFKDHFYAILEFSGMNTYLRSQKESI